MWPSGDTTSACCAGGCSAYDAERMDGRRALLRPAGPAVETLAGAYRLCHTWGRSARSCKISDYVPEELGFLPQWRNEGKPESDCSS